MRNALVALTPLLATLALFFAITRSGTPAPWFRTSLPDEPFRADRCTWYCHNHNCPHAPVMPAALTGDAGLYGWTIRALKKGGRDLSNRSDVGYGAMNLIVFCVVWPGAMYALALVALAQRRRIRAMNAERATGAQKSC